MDLLDTKERIHRHTVEEALFPLFYSPTPNSVDLEAYALKFIGDATKAVNECKAAIKFFDMYCPRPYSVSAFRNKLEIISDQAAEAIPSVLNEQLVLLTYTAMHGQCRFVQHHPLDEDMMINIQNTLYEAVLEAICTLVLDMTVDQLYSYADKFVKE